MKLSSETLEIIKNFSTINPSIKFPKGNTIITANTGGDIIAKATVKEAFPIQVLIHDLNSFCSTVITLKDPDIDFQENFCVLTSGRRSIKYFYSDPAVVKTIRNIKDEFSYKASFDITSDELKDLFKLSASTNTDELKFTASKDGVLCTSYDIKGGVSTTVDYEFSKKEYTEDISVSLPISNLNLLKRSYEVSLSEIVIRFSSENLTYYVRTTYKR